MALYRTLMRRLGHDIADIIFSYVYMPSILPDVKSAIKPLAQTIHFYGDDLARYYQYVSSANLCSGALHTDCKWSILYGKYRKKSILRHPDIGVHKFGYFEFAMVIADLIDHLQSKLKIENHITNNGFTEKEYLIDNTQGSSPKYIEPQASPEEVD